MVSPSVVSITENLQEKTLCAKSIDRPYVAIILYYARSACVLRLSTGQDDEWACECLPEEEVIVKGLIWLGVIGVIIGFAFYGGVGKMLHDDPGQYLAMACGNPDGGTVEFQVAIGLLTVRRDPPRLMHGKHGAVEQWDDWISAHYTLRDQSGNEMTLERSNFGNLLPSAKVGTPDSYLRCRIPAPGTYTFDFVPVVSEEKRYRCDFTCEADGRPYERIQLALVE